MERLTSNRTWDEAKDDLKNELGYSHIWQRLNQIENILGDDYDFEELKEKLENKWISVKDRLPDTVRPVLVYAKNQNNVVFIWILSYFRFDPVPHWQHHSADEKTGEEVLYWMELPEPPKDS